jgi:hypothetical protein
MESAAEPLPAQLMGKLGADRRSERPVEPPRAFLAEGIEEGERRLPLGNGELGRTRRDGEQFEIARCCDLFSGLDILVEVTVGEVEGDAHLVTRLEEVLAICMAYIRPLVEGGSCLDASHDIAETVLMGLGVVDVVGDDAAEPGGVGEIA